MSAELFTPDPAPAKPAVKMTEAQVLALLRERHCRTGNGGSGEYAFMTHVRNGAGFNSNRTFDAVAFSLWPSRGLMLHAFEVKCSRSDWLRELKDPAKAEDAAKCCDQFSLVVSDRAIVATGELPPTWGLLAVTGRGLRCVKEAPLLPGADPKRPIPREFLVALLREGGLAESRRAEYETLRGKVREFETAAGVSLTGWSAKRTPAEVGSLLRSILDGENRADRARHQIAAVRDQLLAAAEGLARFAVPSTDTEADRG